MSAQELLVSERGDTFIKDRPTKTLNYKASIPIELFDTWEVQGNDATKKCTQEQNLLQNQPAV